MKMKKAILLLSIMILSQMVLPLSQASRDYRGNVRPIIIAENELFSITWRNNQSKRCYRVILQNDGKVKKHTELIESAPVEFWVNKENDKYESYKDIAGINRVQSVFVLDNRLIIYGTETQSLDRLKVSEIVNDCRTKVFGNTYRVEERLVASNLVAENNNCYVCWIDKFTDNLVLTRWDINNDTLTNLIIKEKVTAKNTFITMARIDNVIGITYHDWDGWGSRIYFALVNIETMKRNMLKKIS